ncbi:MAG: ABC transporter ATP-binding protein [Deltaproteobacteria bacterium]
MKYALEIKNLTKRYKNFRAVNNLSLNVPEGKIYGFLGRNGAGKTTTIRMIMGLIKPDSGQIHVLGKDIQQNRLWGAKNIGSIIETPGFYENLTAVENLDITAAMFKVKKKRIAEVLDIVNLSSCETKKARDFSLGMKQRLGIANALIHSPKILILDEPTNGLDPEGIRDMRDFLRMLSEKHGITVMISSHILNEVQQIADYAGIIDQGSLIEEMDIQSIIEGNQSYLLLEVDNPQKTLAILKDLGYKYLTEQDFIRVYCNKSCNSILNRKLVEANICVNSLSSISQTLEERFLSIIAEKNTDGKEACNA